MVTTEKIIQIKIYKYNKQNKKKSNEKQRVY